MWVVREECGKKLHFVCLVTGFSAVVLRTFGICCFDASIEDMCRDTNVSNVGLLVRGAARPLNSV